MANNGNSKTLYANKEIDSEDFKKAFTVATIGAGDDVKASFDTQYQAFFDGTNRIIACTNTDAVEVLSDINLKTDYAVDKINIGDLVTFYATRPQYHNNKIIINEVIYNLFNTNGSGVDNPLFNYGWCVGALVTLVKKSVDTLLFCSAQNENGFAGILEAGVNIDNVISNNKYMCNGAIGTPNSTNGQLQCFFLNGSINKNRQIFYDVNNNVYLRYFNNQAWTPWVRLALDNSAIGEIIIDAVPSNKGKDFVRGGMQYLLCDGRVINQSEYPELYTIYPTLPNLNQDSALRGITPENARDVGSFEDDAIKTHTVAVRTFTVKQNEHSHVMGAAARQDNYNTKAPVSGVETASGGSTKTTIATNKPTSGVIGDYVGAEETRMKNVAVQYYVKAKLV